MFFDSLQMIGMASPGGGQDAQSPLFPFVIMGAMVLMFYFLLIRPQQKREKERRALMANIKSGDRIVFGGGLMGLVANVKEKTVMVKIADNVKVEVVRGAITQVLGPDEQPAMDEKK